jgi:hypothetical protein
MISIWVTLILLGLGGLAGFFGGDPSALRGASGFEAALIAGVAFLAVVLGRCVERAARGIGNSLARVANRNADFKPAWSSGKWTVGFGVFAMGLGLGFFTLYLKGDAASAWPALGVAGAGCGLIAGELIARRVFGLGKERFR